MSHQIKINKYSNKSACNNSEFRMRNAELLSPLYQEGMSRRDRGVFISNTKRGMQNAELPALNELNDLNWSFVIAGSETTRQSNFNHKGHEGRKEEKIMMVGDSTATAWGIRKKNLGFNHRLTQINTRLKFYKTPFSFCVNLVKSCGFISKFKINNLQSSILNIKHLF